MNGIYAMYYTGKASCGNALFSMKNGVISGADAVGGMLDGSYEEADDGIDVSLTIKSLPGTSLITGQLVERDSPPKKIVAKLPSYFWGGNSIGLQTPYGPINVIFRRLREAA